MLNKINDIREFRNHHLGDIPHTVAVEPDPERGSNGFEAHAIIATPLNKYKMSAFSSHLPPPAGAPAECASLGTVIFFDPVDDTTVIGPRGDRVFLDVSRRIHHREFSDAISLARRALAEAEPASIKAAQEKLSFLVSAGAKWGIDISRVPMAPKPATTVAAASVAVEIARPPIASEPPAQLSASEPVAPVKPADEPMIGLPIVFICNPGEGAAGMTTVPGAVTRMWPDGSVGLLMFVDDHEVQHRPKVYRRGTDAGNGRTHQTGCWDLADWYKRLITENRQLSERVSGLADKLAEIAAENAKLTERLTALEAKPRRGRPAKPEGGEVEAAEPAVEGEAAKDAEHDLVA